MKRIIDGVTYNTATSTLLAKSEYDATYNHRDYPCTGKLYETQGGAFFVHENIDLGWDADQERQEVRDRFEAYSSEKAHAWIMNGDVEIIHNPFDEPPEAVAEAEPGATIYVRVPLSLKRRLETAAKAESISGNAWAIRCVESCLGKDRSETAAQMTELKSYLAEKLPSNGKGEITAERLREALTGVAAIVGRW